MHPTFHDFEFLYLDSQLMVHLPPHPLTQSPGTYLSFQLHRDLPFAHWWSRGYSSAWGRASSGVRWEHNLESLYYWKV